MEEELTKEEIDRRAQELARKVMSTPYQKQEWPGKSKPKPDKSEAPKSGRTN
jgi:hypothetical protein